MLEAGKFAQEHLNEVDFGHFIYFPNVIIEAMSFENLAKIVGCRCCHSTRSAYSIKC